MLYLACILAFWNNTVLVCLLYWLKWLVNFRLLFFYNVHTTIILLQIFCFYTSMLNIQPKRLLIRTANFFTRLQCLTHDIFNTNVGRVYKPTFSERSIYSLNFRKKFFVVLQQQQQQSVLFWMLCLPDEKKFDHY